MYEIIYFSTHVILLKSYTNVKLNKKFGILYQYLCMFNKSNLSADRRSKQEKNQNDLIYLLQFFLSNLNPPPQKKIHYLQNSLIFGYKKKA